MRHPVLVSLLIGALAIVAPVVAHAQPRGRGAVTTQLLDVIGPRSTSSVRAWLGRSARALEPCRGTAASVGLTFAIAPDGALLDVRAREGDGLDPDASSCVRDVVATWRMPGRASSVTTVVWTLSLAEFTTRCFCSRWVHGPDFGTACEPTRAACEAEIEASGRDHTACEPTTRPRCDDEATIDGQRMRHD